MSYFLKMCLELDTVNGKAVESLTCWPIHVCLVLKFGWKCVRWRFYVLIGPDSMSPSTTWCYMGRVARNPWSCCMQTTILVHANDKRCRQAHSCSFFSFSFFFFCSRMYSSYTCYLQNFNFINNRWKFCLQNFNFIGTWVKVQNFKNLNFTNSNILDLQ